MKKKLFTVFALVAGLLIASTPLAAHHGATPCSPSGSSGTPGAAGLMRAVWRPARVAVTPGARKSKRNIGVRQAPSQASWRPTHSP